MLLAKNENKKKKFKNSQKIPENSPDFTEQKYLLGEKLDQS